MALHVVDSYASMEPFLESLVNLPSSPPSLYIDFKCSCLSQSGSISLLQIYVLPTNQEYVLDVQTLGHFAFNTATATAPTLRTTLESGGLPKVCLHLRNGRHALCAQFGINVRGFYDMRMMELAHGFEWVRKVDGGPLRCILNISQENLDAYEAEGAMIMDSMVRNDQPGQVPLINVRPIPQEVIDRCALDCTKMPAMWSYQQWRLLSNAGEYRGVLKEGGFEGTKEEAGEV